LVPRATTATKRSDDLARSKNDKIADAERRMRLKSDFNKEQ